MHVFHVLSKATVGASVVIKALVAAIVFFYLLAHIPGVYSFLAITPSLLIPPNFRLWTFATGLLMEASVVNILIDVPVIVYCGVYVEPLWGALELLKYISVTGIGTALLTAFVSLLGFLFTQNYNLWSVQFSGIAGVVGAIMVAFKQISPDHKIDLNYKVFQFTDLPFLTIMLYIFLSAVRLFSYTQPIMVICGILIGWVYLRFYQSRGKGMRGDMSEGFDFSSLLPVLVRPPVRFFCNLLFGALVKCGMCTHPVKTYDVGAPSSITISLPGSDPADAERRRKKALRALNERLQQMKTNQSPDDSWPTYDQKDESPIEHSSELTDDNGGGGELC